MFKSVCYQLFDICCHLLPVSKNRFFFESLGGQYNDNPKYISQAIQESYPEIRQFWAISSKSKQNDIPDYVTIIPFGSLKYYFIKNTCRVVVENSAGLYVYHTKNKFIFRLKKLLKNKKQLDLATWHGNPIKHIGAQEPCNIDWTSANVYSTADYMISGASFVASIFEKAYLGLFPVILTGTPRTDILINADEEAVLSLRRKLQLPLDKKIVLYAPTFRYTPEDSGVKQLKMIDYPKLFDSLHNKFGGEWCFVFRVHNMVLQSLDTESIVKRQKITGRILNGNLYDDMNEYLAASDVLISDYSGCVYDVALTKTPCFLFAHDRVNYEKNERGIYTPLSFFPYSFSDSFVDLLKKIDSYSEEETDKNRIRFLEEIGNVETGNSAKKVAEFLIRKLR